jgi:hypothetical protein
VLHHRNGGRATLRVAQFVALSQTTSPDRPLSGLVSFIGVSVTIDAQHSLRANVRQLASDYSPWYSSVAECHDSVAVGTSDSA